MLAGVWCGWRCVIMIGGERGDWWWRCAVIGGEGVVWVALCRGDWWGRRGVGGAVSL